MRASCAKPSKARRPPCNASFRILPGLRILPGPVCQDFQEPPLAKWRQDKSCSAFKPLHQLPSLGICALNVFALNHYITSLAWASAAMHQLRPSCLAAGLLLDAASAPTKGRQVMCRPRPLHQLPSLGIGGDASAAPFWPGCGAVAGCCRRPGKRRTSNVSPSTITSAP